MTNFQVLRSALCSPVLSKFGASNDFPPKRCKIQQRFLRFENLSVWLSAAVNYVVSRNLCFSACAVVLAGLSVQKRPTPHAVDASPRSVSTHFSARKAGSVSVVGSRGKAPLMFTVRRLH